MKTGTEIEERMNSLEQKDLGGDHLWFKPNGSTLTVSRCNQGFPVEKIEGAWTMEEIRVARKLYEETEAGKR